MHQFFMDEYGDYLKSHYSDLSEMTCHDLEEAKCIADTMKAIFEADLVYNKVNKIEKDLSCCDHDSLVKCLEQLYEDSTDTERSALKTDVMGIFS